MPKAVETEIFPWQKDVWTRLWQVKSQQRLPHAILLQGIQGIGKTQFAVAFAAAVLCSKSNTEGLRCQVCHNCCMINANMHPDLTFITPEAAGKKIGVDVIRDLIKNVSETTLKGGFRVVIIHPAAAMNTNAANALLKTLEEPAPHTLIILVGQQHSRLPATITSRCQKINLLRPEKEMALAWLRAQVTTLDVPHELLLQLAQGAPLQALAMHENNVLALRHELYQSLLCLPQKQTSPLQIAAQYQNGDHLLIVDLLIGFVMDILRCAVTQTGPVNADFRTAVDTLSRSISTPNLLAYSDFLQRTRAELLSAINLNKQLLFEDIFIRWANYASC